MFNLDPWKRSIAHYFRWLKRRHPGFALQFAQRLKSARNTDVDGAIGEALVWNFLDDREFDVELSEANGGGPDFSCRFGQNAVYVEATAYTRLTVQEATSLPIEFQPGARTYENLTGPIWRRVHKKAGQFADLQLDAPLLVFVVTLHDSGELLFHQGHVELLLHNEPVLTWPRNHISAVLVGAFASDPPRGRVRGAILPGANYALDPALLPDVELCRFRQWPPRDGEPSEIEWINTQPDCPANPAARELIRRVQAELDGRCRDKERVEKLDRWARGELTLSDSEVSNLFRSTDSGSSGSVLRGRPRRDRRLWRGV